MANKIASVYKFEYEMAESVWTAFVAGFTQDECFHKLTSMTNKRISKLNGTQYECRLDAISNEMIKDINKPIVDQMKSAVGVKNDSKEVISLKKRIGELEKQITDIDTKPAPKKPGRPAKVK
jgi:hypothetical protein